MEETERGEIDRWTVREVECGVKRYVHVFGTFQRIQNMTSTALGRACPWETAESVVPPGSTFGLL
jgi:hypothetical protein